MNTTADTSVPARGLVRRTVHFLFGSWAAWIYLAVVAASIIFAAASLATYTGTDANLAGVWPLFATMPWSLMLIGFVPHSGESTLGAVIAVVVVSTLANLATIGGLMHVIRRPPTTRTAPHA